MRNKNILLRLLAAGVAAVLVGVDQAIKAWALEALPGAPIEVVKGLFSLTYVENRGAAFGLLQGKTALLSVITGAVLLALLAYLLFGKLEGRLLTASLTLVLAGGTGNLVDRVGRGFVVDYLDFSAIFGFPVFNFADCCVVVGTLLLLCCIAWGDFAAKKKAAVPPESETE